MDEVCFWDTRVKGTPDLFKHINSYILNKNTSVANGFKFLQSRHMLIGKKIRNLFIICHGIVDEKQLKLFQHTYGYDSKFDGIVELGKEELTLLTVPIWTSIRGYVKNIILYVCMAAHTPKGAKGTIKDGRLLMSKLAAVTNATVYASDKSQLYTPDLLQFKKWEGKVYQFSPKGTIKQVTSSFVRSITGKI